MSSFISKRILMLTPESAFNLFLLFFLLGVSSIYLNYYPIEITLSIVLIYSLILRVGQRRYYQSLSIETKNSPYFLGFLFTLACLCNILLNLGEQGAVKSDVAGFLVPQISAALLTTIAGLIMRQFIITSDPGHDEQEKLFQAATEELKENISSYRLAQQKLLDLVDEFVETRSTLIEEEQKASRQHIQLLSESTDALVKVGKQYPPKVLKLIESLDNIQNRFDTFVNEGLPETFDQLYQKTSLHLENMHQGFVQAIQDFFNRMELQMSTLESRINDFSQGFYNCNLILDDGFRGKLTQIETNFSELSSLTQSVKLQFQNSNQELLDSLKTLEQFVISFENHVRSFDEFHRERLRILGKELKEVDQLIDVFIEVTRKRLE